MTTPFVLVDTSDLPVGRWFLASVRKADDRREWSLWRKVAPIVVVMHINWYGIIVGSADLIAENDKWPAGTTLSYKGYLLTDDQAAACRMAARMTHDQEAWYRFASRMTQGDQL